MGVAPLTTCGSRQVDDGRIDGDEDRSPLQSLMTGPISNHGENDLLLLRGFLAMDVFTFTFWPLLHRRWSWPEG